MTDNVWHYPPDFPEPGSMIIWISNMYGRLNCKSGIWLHRKDGGKNTGSCILRWAYLKDVMHAKIYEDWIKYDKQPVVKDKVFQAKYRQLPDGCIEINGVVYQPKRLKND